jgi:hypothetical protein
MVEVEVVVAPFLVDQEVLVVETELMVTQVILVILLELNHHTQHYHLPSQIMDTMVVVAFRELLIMAVEAAAEPAK